MVNYNTPNITSNTMPYLVCNTSDGTSNGNPYSLTWGVSTSVTEFRTSDRPYDLYTVIIPYGNGAVTTNTNFYWYANSFKTPAERLKEILNKRMSPNVITTCRPLGYTEDIREMRARETLRRVLGEDKFRDFIRRGSISIRAKSGLVYQIFPGQDFTKVYNCGKLVDRLCVVLRGGFPPTDSLIMRYLMLLNNELQFRSYAVKQGITNPVLPIKPDQRTLVEIFKEMKKAA